MLIILMKVILFYCLIGCTVKKTLSKHKEHKQHAFFCPKS